MQKGGNRLGRLVVKFIANGIVVVPLLMWFSEAGFFASLATALALGLLAYLIGDQLVLRYTNNVVATLSDALLAYAFLWFVADMMDWMLSAGELLVIVVFLGVVEWVYHRYLANRDDSYA